jgi:hypothetical protein
MENWREEWSNRIKLYRHDKLSGIKRWIDKHQHEYEFEILIDIHPKDGYVAYIENE